MKIPLSLIRQQWNHFWLRPCPPHTMAIVRIIFGLYLFLYIGRYATRATLMFSSTGMALPLYYDPYSETITILLFSIVLAACLTLAVGLFMRTSAAIVAGLGLHFWQLNGHLFPATIQRILLLILCIILISDADNTFSVRMWLKQKSFRASKESTILAQRLLAITITAIYLGAGWQKFAIPVWRSGDLLAFSLISSWATPLGFSLVRLGLPIEFYDASVYLIKFFFFVLPIALWIPRARTYAFLGGAVFHTLVAMLLSIWSFLVFIPLYIVFLEPEDVKNWLYKA